MSMESVNSDEDFDMQQLFTSRYVIIIHVIILRYYIIILRGHIGMAQELVQHRGGDAPPSSSGDTTATTTTSCCWKGVPLSWPADDPDVMDEIRDATGMTTPSLLWDACRGGHVEAVKWVMSTFVGVGSEPWELVEPFHGAVRGGHSDVLKWLASNTDAVAACRTAARMERWSVGDFFQTPSLEVVKLCVGWLCGEERDPIEGEDILSSFIMHSSSSCGGKEVEEGCKWIKESFSVTTAPNLLDCINNEEALQWVIKSFNITAENDLWYLLKYSKSVKLLLWLPTLINIYNNPNTFIEEACCNPQDSVSVVEALFSAVLPRPSTLPIQQLQEFLKHSLDHGNTHISDWLENTFHVMGGVNADHSVAVSMFPKISSFGGIQWFVSHATRETLHILSESSAVTEALKNNILSGLCSSLLLLLDTFKISVPPQIRPVVVEQVVSTGNISQAKQILMFHGNFSSDEVAEGLTDSGHHVRSGKVVKWLIKKFHLDEEQVRLHDNHLLKDLLWKQKTNCAEWLIHKFNFTLDEVYSCHCGAAFRSHDVPENVEDATSCVC
ncbi:hypothetical protein Pelo_9644 [Pelomyxa schiedti]|nr:hypothetical protein Pelo_9644 [Pelomyxa schiedti]